MRQQYDLGRKDSLVTDSTVIPLFYPRLRFEHTLKFASNRYHFQDMDNAQSQYELDSTYYFDNYGIIPGDTLMLTDNWREIHNDFSIYQFPDAQNLQQFIKAGVAYQLLQGNFNNGNTPTLYNLMVHGEYRNRTRNRKWDMMAFGNLYQLFLPRCTKIFQQAKHHALFWYHLQPGTEAAIEGRLLPDEQLPVPDRFFKTAAGKCHL
jgi:hypothetical protein